MHIQTAGCGRQHEEREHFWTLFHDNSDSNRSLGFHLQTYFLHETRQWKSHSENIVEKLFQLFIWQCDFACPPLHNWHSAGNLVWFLLEHSCHLLCIHLYAHHTNNLPSEQRTCSNETQQRNPQEQCIDGLEDKMCAAGQSCWRCWQLCELVLRLQHCTICLWSAGCDLHNNSVVCWSLCCIHSETGDEAPPSLWDFDGVCSCGVLSGDIVCICALFVSELQRNIRTSSKRLDLAGSSMWEKHTVCVSGSANSINFGEGRHDSNTTKTQHWNQWVGKCLGWLTGLSKWSVLLENVPKNFFFRYTSAWHVSFSCLLLSLDAVQNRFRSPQNCKCSFAQYSVRIMQLKNGQLCRIAQPQFSKLPQS